MESTNIKPESQAPVGLPVILAAWEAEIRRITVPGQPSQILPETHLQK
jgi:hypothetical protein